MRLHRRPLALLVGALTVSALTAACGSSDTGSAASGGTGGSGSDTTLTLYNAQHEDLMKLMVDGFTKKTGVKVQMRNGDDFELANQLVQEGKRSPADVFVTENSPAMTLVQSKGLFAPVSATALAQVDPQYAPADQKWVGFAARSTVLAYNPSLAPAASLPATILDTAAPQWKGQVGIAPAGADFQAIVAGVLAVKGKDATEQWLAGLKANAKIYRGNGAILKAVNAGEIKTGIIYHYYWYKDRAEAGTNSTNVELKFWQQDAGAFLSVSGAGALASSKHPEQAQQLVTFLTSPEGQKILADSNALEYPIGKGAAANKALTPLAELKPPVVKIGDLDGAAVKDLLQQAGLL